MNFSGPQSIFPGNEIAGKLTSPVASSARPTILADYPLLPAVVPRRSWGSCSGSLCASMVTIEQHVGATKADRLLRFGRTKRHDSEASLG
ncbi:hypothetical protein K0M31_013936 [Melipona bicolor]|uniref:Uncharacterized protein n=1 Tax=Melipona bicolor TaxID=60889 RepID=A0AA40KTX5_9HYME|nr:hypothetical protein K0M31_013936 [Melipona bicolor]